MSLQDEAILHTVHVIAVDENNKPAEFGCGCLIVFRKTVFVLTVLHILTKVGEKAKLVLVLHNNPLWKNTVPNWYILNPMKFKPYILKHPLWFGKFLTKICNLWNKLHIGKPVNPLKLSIREGKEPIDFASCIIDARYFLKYTFPIVSFPVNSPYFGMPYKFFDYKLQVQPVKDQRYAFYGMINLDPTNYSCQEIYIDDAEYLKTEGHYHAFRVNVDNSKLHGCSGAPILDSNGNLVSLVVKSDKTDKHIIYGINLKTVDMALHFEVNNITGESIYE